MYIRRAHQKDITTLVDFQMHMAEETEHIKLDVKTVTRGIQTILNDINKGCYYVAEEDNQLVGCLFHTYEWSDWRCATIWWIQSVYVAKQGRRKKIFERLYEHIKNQALADASVCGIRLYVEKHNQIARQAYRHVGMLEDRYDVFEWMQTQY